MLLKKSEGGFDGQHRNRAGAFCVSIIREPERLCIILAENRCVRRRGRLFQQYRPIADARLRTVSLVSERAIPMASTVESVQARRQSRLS